MNLWQRLTAAYKAISHRPDLAGRVHVYSEYSANQVATQKESSADYEQVYSTYVWVHKAVQKISDSFASLYVQVVDKDDAVVDGHDLETLLNRGNPAMSPVQMWERYVIDMMLHGESFLEIVTGARNRPAELWPRSPDRVSIQPDISRESLFYPQVARYVWKPSDTLGAVDFEPDFMIHDKFYNPLNQWRGLAPIAAVREGITIDMFAQAWSKRFLKNNARPDFVITAPIGLTQTERDRIEHQFMRRYGGEENWHKPAVLEEGTTISPFSAAPADIQWLEQRHNSRDEIGAVFGVPDEIMGYGKDTYENFQTALEVFWTLTVKPLAEHRDDNLTHFFTYVRPMLQPGQRIATDFSTVGILQEDIAPKVEMALKFKALGYTPNQINERLSLGMPDIDDAPPPAITVIPPQADPQPPQLQDTESQRALYLPMPVRMAVHGEVKKSMEIRAKLESAGTFDAERWEANARKALGQWLDPHVSERVIAAMGSAGDVGALLDSVMEDAAGSDAFFQHTEWGNYP